MEVRVSKLTDYISDIFKTDPILRNIRVVGEISNLKYHSSGAIYFTLKDGDASLRCSMWRQYAELLRYELEDGMEVKAFGAVQVYAKGGSYSLIVRDVEVSGEGGLMTAYRALYGRLRDEGLFDPSHKKSLPLFPRKVCVITSGTGAAVQDILKIIKKRNDAVDVIVCPVLVQGENAAGEIAEAIRDVNSRAAGTEMTAGKKSQAGDRSADKEKECGSEETTDISGAECFSDTDVIIVGRGGGSTEDLWAFNEEPVVRAVYESRIPIISAVGHETDFVLTDFAADVRAETPTAAAAIAVPDIRDVRLSLDSMSEALTERLAALCRERARSVERFSPEQLMKRLRNRYMFDAGRLALYEPQKLTRMIKSRYGASRAALEHESQRLSAAVRSRIAEKENALEKARIMIDGADPERIVKRGYAIITDKNGAVVSEAAGLASGDMLSIRLRDGTAEVEVKTTEVDDDGR